MANLAIRGHATRGKEVIEILGMLGGNNRFSHDGNNPFSVYYVNESYKDYIICSNGVNLDDFVFFTLEEFLEKFPFKVGDKVSSKYLKNYKIEKMEWKDTENRVIYKLQGMGRYSADELQHYKEEPVEERENSVVVNIEHKQLKVHSLKFDKTQLVINDEYELNQEGDTYYIVRKKPQYPKTFIEVLNFWHPDRQPEDDYQRCYKKDLIEKFQDLLYAKDAYWKIAGEEMGLGQPWEPQFENCSIPHYCIFINHTGKVCNACFYGSRCLLAFPTEEMRDAFYENFRNEIEQCKEFL